MIKKFLKKIIERFLNIIFDEYKKRQNQHNNISRILHNQTSQAEQRRLFFYYKELLNEKKILPDIRDVGFRIYSQNDEDGILLYLFSLIGFENKKCLDIAFASPYGANTTNLLTNWNFTGLLVCGDENEKKYGEKFFNTHPDTVIYPPKIINKWVTGENINEILLENDFTGSIDFLSLDIDGIDYWIWNNLKVVNPRLVLVEYHNIWGDKKSVTVPYKKDFNRFDVHKDFMGASLPAYVKLAEKKGYRLVGCNKYGFNAFFLRKGIAEETIPTLSIKDCLSHPQALDGIKNRLPAVENLDWLEV
ncbi:MAG: hypothetical protein WC436_02535 [Candidatus Babeliales bacterium]